MLLLVATSRLFPGTAKYNRFCNRVMPLPSSLNVRFSGLKERRTGSGSWNTLSSGLFGLGLFGPGLFALGQLGPGLFGPGLFGPGLFGPGLLASRHFCPGLFGPGLFVPGLLVLRYLVQGYLVQGYLVLGYLFQGYWYWAIWSRAIWCSIKTSWLHLEDFRARLDSTWPRTCFKTTYGKPSGFLMSVNFITAGIRDFKIRYGEVLVRLLWPRGTRLTNSFLPPC